MAIWLIFALMTGAAVMCVLWPLSRRAESVSSIGDETDFFRRQLAEIDREKAQGLLSPEEGEAARVEASRRLLQAADGAQQAQAENTRDQQGEPALRRRRAASAIAISTIPLVALTLYGAFGSPHLPDQPLAPRLEIADPQRLAPAEMVARVEGHLARQPDDAQGWEVLAPIYLRLGRFADAANAYDTVIRLSGENARRLSGRGEAKALAEAGIVTAAAKEDFAKALATDPENVQAAFYLGVAAEQDGNREEALARFRALLANERAAPMQDVLRPRIRHLEQQPQSGESGHAPVLTEDAAKTLLQLPPDQQRQAIQAMVTQLGERIAREDASPEDWLRLVRAYAVIGDKAAADDAYRRAKDRFKGDAATLGRLDTLAEAIKTGTIPVFQPAE